MTRTKEYLEDIRDCAEVMAEGVTKILAAEERVVESSLRLHELCRARAEKEDQQLGMQMRALDLMDQHAKEQMERERRMHVFHEEVMARERAKWEMEDKAKKELDELRESLGEARQTKKAPARTDEEDDQ